MRGDPGDSPAVAPQQPFRPMRDTPDGSDDTDDREERDATQQPPSGPEPKGDLIQPTNRLDPPPDVVGGPIEGTVPPTDDPQSSEAKSPQSKPGTGGNGNGGMCPPGMVAQGAACVDERLTRRIGEQTKGAQRKAKETRNLLARITPQPIPARFFAMRIARSSPQLNKKKYRKFLLDVGNDIAAIVNAQRKLQVFSQAARARPELATFIDSRIRGAQQQIKTHARKLKAKGIG